jgi:RNA polymerase sigma-70 factor (ECF subfamily)
MNQLAVTVWDARLAPARARPESRAMATSPDVLTEHIARCALGDERALAELYRLTRGRMYAVALRMLRRTDLAEEALQESFLKVWRNAGSFRPDLSAPTTWITSIVRNQCLDMLRRGKNEHALRDYLDEDDDSLEQVADEGSGPLEIALQGQAARALSACMQKLREQQQKLIARAFYEGLSHSELAVATGMPLGTVKTSIRRGLTALRECLEGRAS